MTMSITVLTIKTAENELDFELFYACTATERVLNSVSYMIVKFGIIREKIIFEIVAINRHFSRLELLQALENQDLLGYLLI